MSSDRVERALWQTIERIEKKPKTAQVVFAADTRLEEGVRCSATVRDLPAIPVDETAALGGCNASVNPVELMLVALGTCQEVLYAAHATILGIQLDAVEIKLRGYLDLQGLLALDPSIPAGFKTIKFETRIVSPDSPEKIKQLIELVESHCPVLDSLTRAVTTSSLAYLNGAALCGSSAALKR